MESINGGEYKQTQKTLARRRELYQQNKAKELARKQKYRDENKEKLGVYAEAYRNKDKNKTKMKSYQKEYRAENNPKPSNFLKKEEKPKPKPIGRPKKVIEKNKSDDMMKKKTRDDNLDKKEKMYIEYEKKQLNGEKPTFTSKAKIKKDFNKIWATQKRRGGVVINQFKENKIIEKKNKI